MCITLFDFVYDTKSNWKTLRELETPETEICRNHWAIWCRELFGVRKKSTKGTVTVEIIGFVVTLSQLLFLLLFCF